MGSAEQQAACRARLDDLEPPIRYCAYQLDKAGGGAGALTAEPNSPVTTRLQVCMLSLSSWTDFLCRISPNNGRAGNEHRSVPVLLQERLAAFATQQPNHTAEPADEVSGLDWRGAHYPARSETVRAALAPVAAAERELVTAPAAAAGTSGSGDMRLVKLDRLGNAYAGALAAVQSAIANGALLALGQGHAAMLGYSRIRVQLRLFRRPWCVSSDPTSRHMPS